MYKNFKALAALLAVLLALVAAAGAEEVKSGQTYYDQLEDMVTNVSITDAEVIGNTWIVRPDTRYEMTVGFSETGSKQFKMDSPDSDQFTYHLPAGIVLDFQQGDGDIGFKYDGKEYPVPFHYTVDTEGNVEITFNYDEFLDNLGDDMSDAEKRGLLDALKNATDLSINLKITGQFSEREVRLEWGNEVTTDIKLKHDLKVEKTADYERDDGYVYYTLTVTSEGNNTNIDVKDIITGNALELDTNYSEYGENGIKITDTGSSTCTLQSIDDKSFKYNIASMADGQVIKFEYRAKINYKADPDNGTLTYDQTKNTATVKGDKTDEKQVNQGHSIRYSSVSKGSGQVKQQFPGEDGKIYQRVLWTVEVNKERLVSIGGTTLTDTIQNSVSDPKMYYSGDGITVEVYDIAGNLVGGEPRSIPWENVGVQDKSTATSYTYPFPQEDGKFYYKITYTTDVDVTGLDGSGSVKNTATGKYGPGYGETGITTGEKPGLSKSVVDYNLNEVTWQVTIQVPAGGLSGYYSQLVDDIPMLLSHRYADEYINGSLQVSGLQNGDQYSDPPIVTVLFNGRQRVSIKFTKPDGTPGFSASNDGLPYEVIITFKTKNNEEWNKFAAEHVNEGDHINTVQLGDISDTAEATIIPPFIDKYLTTGKFEDYNGKKYLEYEIVVGDVTNEDTPLTILDKFDTDVIRVVTAAEAAASNNSLHHHFSVYGGTQNSQITEIGTATYNNTDEGIVIIIPDKNTYSYIKVHYWLALKDGIDPDQFAHNSLGGKWETTNTAYWNDVSDEVTFTYDYDYLMKELTNADDLGGNNRIAKYKITYNPDQGTINNGEPITLTDTWSKTLNIDYSSIKITTEPKDRDADVSYNISGYTATYTIPDRTKVIIEYDALIIGEGDNIEISNTASDEYREETIDKKYGLSGSGGGSAIDFAVLKVDDNNNRIRIKDVVFKLTAPKGFSLKNNDDDGVYEIELSATDVNGETKIAANQGYQLFYYDARKYMPEESFDENDPSTYVTYTLTEVAPPSGYASIGGSYTLSFTNDPSKINFENGKYIYYFESQSIQVKNKPLAGLIVQKKTVSDESDDKDQSFQFEITLTNEPPITRKYGDMDFVNNVATFSLKDGEYKQAIGLPSGIKYTIEETGADGFTTVSTGRTADGGILPSGGTMFTGTTQIEGTEVTFTNTKTSPTSITFQAIKVLTGRKLDGEEFSFEVYEIGDPDHPIQTVTNNADGVVHFEPISYASEGRYTYIVKEVLPEGVTAENPTKDGITYDLTSYTITVDVVDYGDGNLGAGIIDITENK